MPRRKVVQPARPCACGRTIPEGTSGRIKRCTYCRAADPHRNAGKRRSKNFMFVSIDTEGAPNKDTTMRMITCSIGREDGTSLTCITGDAERAIKWLIRYATGTYSNADGIFQLVPVSFHFNYDLAILLKDFVATGPLRKEAYQDLIEIAPDEWIETTRTISYVGDPMFLVRKATATITTNLCGSVHHDGEPCEREMAVQKAMTDPDREVRLEGVLHRYDPQACELVMTEGGEGDVLAFDPNSGLAMAATHNRRFYTEYRPNGDRFEGRKILDIHDTGTAMPGGLEYNIDMWQPELSESQRSIIAWGKQSRKDDLSRVDIRKVAKYSEAECVAHARICRMFVTLVKEASHIELAERKLFGSGSVAQAALKHYGVTKRSDTDLGITPLRYTHDGITPDTASRLTYFGGLIDAPVIGLVKGRVDVVDINSAYPSKMIHLPCMKEGHGKWHRGARKHGYPQCAVVGHVRASWMLEHSDVVSTPPFVVRQADGGVAEPLCSTEPVWVSLAEFKAAKIQFGDRVELHEVLYWHQTCDCSNPLGWLADLYIKRLELKNAMRELDRDSDQYHQLDVQQNIIKLIINSIYGKLAQQEPDFGTYTNLHWASAITGGTRAQLREKVWEIEALGGTTVYNHTDSNAVIGVTPEDGGSALGAWGLEKPSYDFLIVQPGLATSLTSGKTASRGIREDAFIEAAREWVERLDLTQHPEVWPKLVAHHRVMLSRRQAHFQGKPHLAGSFQPKTTEVRAGSSKRTLEGAEQVEGIPTAWKLRPHMVASEQATVDDLQEYKSQLLKLKEAGELDWLTQDR